MKIALVEPYVSVDSLRAYAEKTEPSHLLGMYNLLKQLGHSVVLLDAYSPRLSVTDLIKYLEAQAVTHVGFTVYDYFPCFTYVRQVFEHLPESISTIIGGPGATYCTERMIQLLRPDWLVKGPGELAMVDLFQSGFSTENLSCRASLTGKTVIVSAEPMLLDDIPFKRPYSLEGYASQASPIIQTGCVGRCIFCSGAYQKKFDYVTRDRAEQLFDYLVNEKNADVIAPNGPDFTAVPEKANALIRVLTEGNFKFKAFNPGVRLDTLYRAIEFEPGIWKRLANTYKINLESSIESFSTSRLKRLGKSVTCDFLSDVFAHLTKILGICECKIVLGRIAIDPTVTIDEFIVDCEGFRRLLHEFRSQVTVGGMLMNQFVALAGTPATEDRGQDNPWISDRLLDSAMLELQENLLSNEQFTTWCRDS